MWPPYSPDLNPLDYSIWNAVTSKACAKPQKSAKALKTTVSRVWNSLDTAYVQRSCQNFRARLEKVIETNGSIIE